MQVYNNVNLSIYSGQTCNARCPFCVEELRPLSKGLELANLSTHHATLEDVFVALTGPWVLGVFGWK